MHRRSLTVADVVRHDLAQSYARLVANEPGIVSGLDPEAVHQARVAVRRVRSDLRTFASFVDPAWAKTLGAELRWLGAELGGVRDLEVMCGRLRAHARRLPTSEIVAAHRVVGRLGPDHERARVDLLAALAQPRYARLRHALDEATRVPVCTQSAAIAARPALGAVAAVRWKKLRRSITMLGDEPSDALLHDVRIRAKRCRYAAEACVIAYGTKAERFASALAAVQDALGENQDAVVAGEWLAKIALECEPGEAYAIGMLAEVERSAGREARARFRRAWAHASRRRLREWQ